MVQSGKYVGVNTRSCWEGATAVLVKGSAYPELQSLLYGSNRDDWTDRQYDFGYGLVYFVPDPPPTGKSEYCMIGVFKERPGPVGYCTKPTATVSNQLTGTISTVSGYWYITYTDVPWNQYIRIYLNSQRINISAQSWGATWKYYTFTFTPEVNPILKIEFYSVQSCGGPFYVGFNGVTVG